MTSDSQLLGFGMSGLAIIAIIVQKTPTPPWACRQTVWDIGVGIVKKGGQAIGLCASCDFKRDDRASIQHGSNFPANHILSKVSLKNSATFVQLSRFTKAELRMSKDFYLLSFKMVSLLFQ